MKALKWTDAKPLRPEENIDYKSKFIYMSVKQQKINSYKMKCFNVCYG